MDRPILWSMSQAREFDVEAGFTDVLYSMGLAINDILMGGQGPFLLNGQGFAATQTTTPSLTINIAAGRIYQPAFKDATAVGAIPMDTTNTYQQGVYPGGTLTFTTAGLAAGQSRFALVQAIFAQSDIIRSGDPTAGVMNFYNSGNPTVPWIGPGNSGTAEPTERQGVCQLQIKYGAVATTGSEVAPSATAGWTPMYLVDLAFGQTTILTGQILLAPGAPFCNGYLNQHHLGTGTGQAPKVVLTAGLEVTGLLPIANQKGRTLVNIQRFLSATSVVPTFDPATTHVEVELIAGSGGSGGVTGGGVSASGAGGSGSYSYDFKPVATYVGQTLVVGAGGAAGANPGGGGGNGVDSTYGPLHCFGGAAGPGCGAVASAYFVGAAGGAIATGGIINQKGQYGSLAIAQITVGGITGYNVTGGGGMGMYNRKGGDGKAGSSSLAGEAGDDGLCIIREYAVL